MTGRYFLIYQDDYSDPCTLVGPFDTEGEALHAYLIARRIAEPEACKSEAGESKEHTAHRLYLDDDNVRLGKWSG